jgi:hypothetical protein
LIGLHSVLKEQQDQLLLTNRTDVDSIRLAYETIGGAVECQQHAQTVGLFDQHVVAQQEKELSRPSFVKLISRMGSSSMRINGTDDGRVDKKEQSQHYDCNDCFMLFRNNPLLKMLLFPTKKEDGFLQVVEDSILDDGTTTTTTTDETTVRSRTYSTTSSSSSINGDGVIHSLE